MFDDIKRLFTPPIFSGDEEKTRAAELLNTILLALASLSVISLTGLILGGSGLYRTYILVAIFTLVLALLQVPLRRGYVRQVGYTIIILFTFVLTFALYNGGTIRAPGVILFSLPVIIGGLVIGPRTGFGIAIINIAIFLTLLWLEVNGRLPEPTLTVNIQQGIIFSAAIIMLAILLNLALRRINISLIQARLGEEKLSALNLELEQRAIERTAELEKSNDQIKKRASQLEAIANTARSAATAQNMDALLTSITKEASSQLGFYHLGIFLLDSNKEYAILSAVNSDGGQKMLTRGHRLKVGEQGIVGFVAARGVARTASDVGEDAIYFDNPDLPETHAELALPLKYGSEIIGVLDIQSTLYDAFTSEDVETFSILADQVSVAIQNTRSLGQAQQALHEAEKISKQSTGHTWSDFVKTVQTKGYRYNGINSEPIKGASKTASDQDVLSVPVRLRGQIIGRLKLKAAEQSRNWTEDELAIIESTAERVAIALEGARLLEDAQKRASRETFLSGMAAKLGTSFQLDSILRDTIEELGQTLKGSKISFQLVDPSALPTFDKNNGSSKNRIEPE